MNSYYVEYYGGCWWIYSTATLRPIKRCESKQAAEAWLDAREP